LRTPVTPALADALALALETPADVLFPDLLDGLLVDHGGVEVALSAADVGRLRTTGLAPALAASDAVLGERLDEALATLSVRDATVLRRRYGLDGEAPMTFRALAEVFGVTVERLRQLEARALRQLEHPLRAKALRPFARARDGVRLR